MNYTLIAILAVISFFISLFTVKYIIKNAAKLGLVDSPNMRSSHTQPTPSFGGLGMLVALQLIVPVIMILTPSDAVMYIIFISIMLGVLGFIDDLLDINSLLRLGFQIFAGVLLCFLDIRLESLFGLFGIYELSVPLQWTLTIFLSVVVINAFNLIDGIDGLAGGLGLFSSLIYFILFALVSNTGFATLSAVIFMSILAFYIFNVHPARIFFGDTGSVPLGFLMMAFALKSLQLHSDSSLQYILLSICPLLVPVLDLVRVAIFRLMKKSSPMKADRTHVHHLLLKSGLNHFYSSLVLYGVYILILTGAIIFGQHSMTKAFMAVVSTFVIFIETLTIIRWKDFRKRITNLRKMVKDIDQDNILIKRNYESAPKKRLNY